MTAPNPRDWSPLLWAACTVLAVALIFLAAATGERVAP